MASIGPIKIEIIGIGKYKIGLMILSLVAKIFKINLKVKVM
jgi:hypothetical protein